MVGQSIGSYTITAKLGEGGMGVVYRARDTKLDREVAIKVLPDSFAQDPERVARFAREARTLAALNHPNIGGIHGFEEFRSGGSSDPPTHALVLELVGGPTLADLIASRAGPSGPAGLPIDEALPIAKQIADALEAAHEQGIIHRDLKPANIKVRDDGTVKVLDFGLAKLTQASGPGPQASVANLTLLPTITSPALMTGVGVLLGTAAYMSPEQAKGKEADKRSDIWAFGCVLYEMLTGQRAFPGDDLSETLAAVIKSEPGWTVLPATTPASIRTLLRRCLEKDRRRRLADAADARLELDDASSLQTETDEMRRSEAAGAPRRVRRERMAWAGGVLLLAVVATVSLVVAFRSPPRLPELRVDVVLPPHAKSPRISPDGRRIAFVAPVNGVLSVWVHSLDGHRARPLDRTSGGFRDRVFWSPDSRSIGFFAEGKLKRVDVESGAVQTIAEAQEQFASGTWNRNGVIVFAPTTGPLFRVSQAGDGLAAVTRVEGPQIRHTQPQFLPDGRHFLFYSSGDSSRQGVYVADLEGATAPRRVLADVDGAVYAASGHMFFSRQSALLAQRFDAERMTFVGDPWQVGEFALGELQGELSFSASEVGPLLYGGGGDGPQTEQRRLIWFDRSGKELQRLDDREPVNTASFSLSRDGDRLAVQSRGTIWLLDADRGGRRTRLASEDPNFSIWSPEGDRLVFQSRRTGVGNLYQRTLTGSTDELFLETPGSKAPNDWSPDGRLLLYRDQDATTGFDLWVVPVEREGKSGRLMTAAGQKARPVANAKAGEMNGQFSPDGAWIAYESDESGQWEIYVQPFERAGERVQISLDGGRFARWRRDGSELYFYAADGWLMAASIRPASNGRIGAGDPVRLFRVPLEPSGGQQPQFLVSPDGQRFLANVITDASPVIVTMIVNWGPPQ